MVSPLPTIVTLAQAKQAANISTVEGDADLHLRLELAHEIVLDYLANQIDDSTDEWLDTIIAWDASTAPRRVVGAILHTFVHLQRWRGDDDAKVQPALENGMPPIVRMMLDRLRDPTIA
jgi:hypothetical protein